MHTELPSLSSMSKHVDQELSGLLVSNLGRHNVIFFQVVLRSFPKFRHSEFEWSMCTLECMIHFNFPQSYQYLASPTDSSCLSVRNISSKPVIFNI